MVKKRFERKKLRFFLTITPLPPMSFHKKNQPHQSNRVAGSAQKKTPVAETVGFVMHAGTKKQQRRLKKGCFNRVKCQGWN